MGKFVIKKLFDFSTAEAFLNNNFSSPTHWPEWNIIISKYYNTKFYYFTAYEKNKLIGLCPVHEIRNGYLKTLHSGQLHFIPYGGWIFSQKTTLNTSKLPTNINEMFLGFSLPILDEFNVIYSKNNTRNFETLIIDLQKDINEIWKNELNSKRRQNIRKAFKNNVQIEIDPKNELNNFYKMYENSCKNNKLNILPKSFFKDMFKISKNICFKIIWAKKENNYLANIVVVYDKNYSFYWLGNNRKYLPFLGQTEILQWEAINSMKANGCKYYDLCYIEKERLPNIYRFKKGFSKTEVPIFFHTKKGFSYRVFNKIQKAFL